MSEPALTIRNLLSSGPIPYNDALTLQRELVQKRQCGEIGDTLLLLEHPPTVTYGKTTRLENLLVNPDEYRERGIELVATDRGGDATYHGPGQLIGYPIIYLGEGSRDIHAYVRSLEEALIAVAHAHGVADAGRSPEHAGVWVGDGYLAALGVRVSRWVTHHGFSLNVTDEVRAGFETIVACGVPNKEIATLSRSSGLVLDTADVTEEVIARFSDVYNSNMRVAARLA